MAQRRPRLRPPAPAVHQPPAPSSWAWSTRCLSETKMLRLLASAPRTDHAIVVLQFTATGYALPPMTALGDTTTSCAPRGLAAADRLLGDRGGVLARTAQCVSAATRVGSSLRDVCRLISHANDPAGADARPADLLAGPPAAIMMAGGIVMAMLRTSASRRRGAAAVAPSRSGSCNASAGPQTDIKQMCTAVGAV